MKKVETLQMDDYGVEDCHHCGDDVNEEGGNNETETDTDSEEG